MGQLHYQKLLQLLEAKDEHAHIRKLEIWLGEDREVRSLPEKIGLLTNLEELEIINTKLERLPDTLCQLKKLKRLELCIMYELKAFPEVICQLTQLESLVLDRCRPEVLQTIPHGLANLKRLKKLVLKDMHINDSVFRHSKVLHAVPKAVNQLAQLKELNLSGSHYVDDLGNLTFLNKLEALDLSFLCNVKTFDPLRELASLRNLDIGSANVKDIGFVDSMPYLEKLDLGSTKLKDISPLAGLKNLQWLDISSTGVCELSVLNQNQLLKHLKMFYCECDDHGRLNTIEALAPLVNHPSLTELEAGEVSQEEWDKRHNPDSPLAIDVNKVEDRWKMIENELEKLIHEAHDEGLKTEAEAVLKFRSAEQVSQLLAGLVESINLYLGDYTDAVARIDLIYWSEYQDHEVMATWIDKHHNPIAEQCGGFSIKDILTTADCIKDDGDRQQLMTRLALHVMYENLHRALRLLEEQDAFRNLPKHHKVDVYLYEHEDTPFMVYRYRVSG